MLKSNWQAGALCVALLLLAGCAREEQPAPVPPTAEYRPSPRFVPGQGVPAATYIAEAGSIELFIIGSSELALQRSASQRMRDFASTMIATHKGTSAELSLAGRRLNLLLSAALNGKHQAMLNELAEAPDFDATYRRQQLEVHREALTLHATYAAHGASPTLRPVASAILPVLQRDMRLLQYL